MAEKDITQIKIGKFGVSIIGIKQLMEEMARTHADKTDDEVRSFMLDRLGQGNYIPSSAKEDYGKAFVSGVSEVPWAALHGRYSRWARYQGPRHRV